MILEDLFNLIIPIGEYKLLLLWHCQNRVDIERLTVFVSVQNKNYSLYPGELIKENPPAIGVVIPLVYFIAKTFFWVT